MDRMGVILSQSPVEIVGAIILIMSILFGFISIFNSSGKHHLKITGLFLLVGVTLFSDDSWTYFASIFIVGTAITRLEFLETLVAIIRGNKEYFKHKTKFQSPSEIQHNIEKEARDLEESVTETNSKLQTSNLSPIQFALIVEEYAFKFLERRYKQPIQRHVRLEGETFAGMFDGIMYDGNISRIFEIKTTKTGTYNTNIIEHINSMTEAVSTYKEITKRQAIFNVILIGNIEEEFRKRLRDYEGKITNGQSGVEIIIETLTFKDIGVEEVLTNT